MTEQLSLTEPISADSPSGADLAYDAEFLELEHAAKLLEEQQYGSVLIEEEEPDWADVERRARKLCAKTHDLRVAVYWLEGLIRTAGWAGLKEGLGLLDEWLRKEWETLHPRLDPEDGLDPTERANSLLRLCDDRRVLAALASLPMASSPPWGTVSHHDVLIAKGLLKPRPGHEPLSLTVVEAVFGHEDAAALRLRRDNLAAAEVALDSISNTFAEYSGERIQLAPLRDLLVAMIGSYDELSPQTVTTGTDEEGNASSPAAMEKAAGQTGEPVPIGTLEIATRDDVITVIDAVCEHYARQEPSSPVPMLLRRARRLVKMDFLEILRDLAPNGLNEAKRWEGTPE